MKPTMLIALVDHSKKWRQAASVVMIELYADLKDLKKQNKAVIGLLSAILGTLLIELLSKAF